MFNKCRKVIDSCEQSYQLKYAKKYIELTYDKNLIDIEDFYILFLELTDKEVEISLES